MPKKSRTKRLLQWLATLLRAVGALFYGPNLKNAFSNVTKNWKEYICFYLAALAVSSGFWMIGLCTEANLHVSYTRVTEAYDYHVEVTGLNNEQYANLDNWLHYEVGGEANAKDTEWLTAYEWANDGKPYSDGTYSVRVRFTEAYGVEAAYEKFEADMLRRITKERREIRFSPLYTYEEDFGTPYTVQFWIESLVWLGFSVLLLWVLFLIRLDHFRFIYGIYMTFGADFPKLMGAAGGELFVILLLTALPAVLLGGGITAALYIPAGVGLHISLRAVAVALAGGFLSAFAAVWFPMRRLSRGAPVKHLQTGDNTPLVSSPRRSFHLFGEGFPGKYELYGFWRMRKYYIRLILSAVIFAAVFVTGLYVADMIDFHNEISPVEYRILYRPDEYYDSLSPGEDIGSEAETEEGEPPVWTPDAEEAELIWDDPGIFLDELDAIEGVDHVEWEASVTGGRMLAHLLLTPEQLYSAGSYTVRTDERASDGYRWATNNYAYTAIDELWIDNMLAHGLCTFEGDPYSVFDGDRRLIISEDIYNDRTFSFSPGDKIIVAVCEQNFVKTIVTDPKELLRLQISENKFRYETYTVAAVARGLSSENTITLGVPFADYVALTGETPVRDELSVYMKAGTDLDVIRAAEGEIRRVIGILPDWTVTPTGNYFDAQVRSLKNDRALILTLAACLLLISPMVWYFSQLMFYRKRRREFSLLRALGAPDASFARVHRVAGGVLSGLAFLATVGLALLCNAGVHFTVNTLLPKLHLTESVSYPFTFSLPALVACVLISVLCGYFSCEVPYRLLMREWKQSGGIRL